MATKKTYIAQQGPYNYDDTDKYPDNSEALAGVRADKIRLDSQSISDKDAVRYDQVKALIDRATQFVTGVTFASLDLSAYTGTADGDLLIAIESATSTPDKVGVFAWDNSTSITITQTSPYVTAGSGGYWVLVSYNFGDVKNKITVDNDLTINASKGATGDLISHGDTVDELIKVDASADTVYLKNVYLDGAPLTGTATTQLKIVDDILLPNLSDMAGTFVGQMLIAYEADAEYNKYSLFAWDTAVANPPAVSTDRFITQGNGGFWICIGGNAIVCNTVTCGDSAFVNNDRTATGDFTVMNNTGAAVNELLLADVSAGEVKINGVPVFNMQKVSVSNITNPAAELAPKFGSGEGDLLLAYQVRSGSAAAANDDFSLYAWDSTGTHAASAQFVVAGTGGYWIIIGGSAVVTQTVTAQGSTVLNNAQGATGDFTWQSVADANAVVFDADGETCKFDLPTTFNGTVACKTNVIINGDAGATQDLTVLNQTSGTLLNCDVSAKQVFVNAVPIQGKVDQFLDNAAEQILPGVAPLIRISAAGTAALTGAPVIVAGVDGQIITIMNIDASNTITLQDDSNDADGGLILAGDADFAMGKYDSIRLTYNSAAAKWIELDRTNV